MLTINFDTKLPDNIMYFANDDDFATFCLDPTLKIRNLDDSCIIYDYDFSKAYLDAVANGVRFCIKDENSHVNKDGYLGYRGGCKKIDNVERYYSED